MSKVILFLAWAILKPVDVDFCTVHKSLKAFPIKGQTTSPNITL